MFPPLSALPFPSFPFPSVAMDGLDGNPADETAARVTPPPVRLSKSKIIAGRQCHKRLWLQIHRPQEADFSASELAFATGYEAGDIAQRLHPGGVLVGDYRDPQGSLARTQALLRNDADATLFEATFEADNVRVMADIVEQSGGELHLIEVKASTSVKPYQREDVAVQAHVMTRSGYRPDRVFLRVIDKTFVYQGDGNYQGLFRDEDVTAETLARGKEVAGWVHEQQWMLAGSEPPIAMGEQCRSPYPCEFIAYCGGACSNSAADAREKNPCAEKIKYSAAEEISKAEYPRYFLALDVINPGVPRWAGTRPWQVLPFQWSLHVEEAEGRVAHHAFLHTGRDAPMRPVIAKLLAHMGAGGTVFVYERALVGRVLRDMAKLYPDVASRLLSVERRLFDVQGVLRSNQNPSVLNTDCLLASVLTEIAPEMTPGLLDGVSDDSEAQTAFFEMLAPATTPARRAERIEQLMRFGKFRSQGLAHVVRALAS